ncbi:uncharacterized protein LOC124428353 [Vespa crabro]|uniref:uncharacterized protein LOC124428353 n=1 Tax=Vespa crabro TaxID=7445 RepID=UPI001F018607|nr:uncharacterized protein LOC124428353 [Vespa crabro]
MATFARYPESLIPQDIDSNFMEIQKSFATLGTVNNSNSILKELRLHIYGNTTEQKFLIDSESIVSILLAKKFRKNRSIDPFTFYAANSSQINTYVAKIIKLDLNLHRDFIWSFIIAAIIGADLLTHYNLLIDLKYQQVIDPVTVVETQHYGISANHQAILKFKSTRICAQNYYGPTVIARARKLTGKKAAATKTQIKKLLDSGIIRPYSSIYASPIHMAREKDNSWRMCSDYRKLNNATDPDIYSHALIQDLFLLLHNKRRYSNKIDGVKAYLKILIHVEDIEKTAVITPWSYYEYLSMPFGVKKHHPIIPMIDGCTLQIPGLRVRLRR